MDIENVVSLLCLLVATANLALDVIVAITDKKRKRRDNPPHFKP